MVQYFDDAARYADLLNGYVFHGQQIVKMEDVQEMDSRKLRKEKSLCCPQLPLPTLITHLIPGTQCPSG